MEKEKLHVVEDTIQYIEETVGIIKKTIEYLRNGEVQLGYQCIDNICQRLGKIIDVLYSTVDQDYINITEINGIIKEMFEAMENQDYILLADLIEFELKDKLTEWNKGLSSIKL